MSIRSPSTSPLMLVVHDAFGSLRRLYVSCGHRDCFGGRVSDSTETTLLGATVTISTASYSQKRM
jgi:hypothetical protein